MRRLRALLCLPLLAAPLQAVTTLTAHATADVGTVQCTAVGQLSTNAGTIPQTVTFSGTLSLDCLGVGDDAGIWSLTMSGQMSPGFCAGGEGLAGIGGSGPDGSVSAGVRVTASATSMHVAGTLGTSDPGGDAFQATLSMTPTSGVPCVNTVTRENLQGQATITDQPPPPDIVFCTGNGVEQYAPGLTLTPTLDTITGQATFTCTGVSDDAGGWNVAYNGVLDGDCGAAEGSLNWNFSGPDTSGAGTADYERVGTMLDIVATSSDNTMEIWGSINPGDGASCATSSWIVSHYSAAATIVE